VAAFSTDSALISSCFLVCTRVCHTEIHSWKITWRTGKNSQHDLPSRSCCYGEKLQLNQDPGSVPTCSYSHTWNCSSHRNSWTFQLKEKHCVHSFSLNRVVTVDFQFFYVMKWHFQMQWKYSAPTYTHIKYMKHRHMQTHIKISMKPKR